MELRAKHAENLNQGQGGGQKLSWGGLKIFWKGGTGPPPYWNALLPSTPRIFRVKLSG